jgi:hypothetical protein
MEKTWKSMTGGILAIIGGVITLFVSLGLFIASAAINYAGRWVNDYGFNGLPLDIAPIFVAFAIPLLLLGILAIIGGVCALQRKYSGLAIAGSIAALFPAGMLGLGAIVFTAISRDEFGPQVKNIAAVNGKSS